MFSGARGKEFLQSYSQLSSSAFDTFILDEIRHVTQISKIPTEALKRFQRTAAEGKRIRGGLVLLGYLLSGNEQNDQIVNASIAVEILHAALLVHDDIMDQDDTRRGISAVHKQLEEIGRSLELSIPAEHYGISSAMSIADAAFFMSVDILLAQDFPPSAVLKAARIFSRYVIDVAYGQILDLTTIGLHSIREDDVLKVLRYKTANYTGVMPLLVGATLGEMDSPDKLKALENYGWAFGWAFQIQDDILGVFGDNNETGKSNISDIKEGKNTLLMLHLSENGTDEQRAFLKSVLGNPNVTQDQADTLRSMLKDAGSYDYVIQKGWSYVNEAIELIAQITSDPELATIMESLVVYMMERTK